MFVTGFNFVSMAWWVWYNAPVATSTCHRLYMLCSAAGTWYAGILVLALQPGGGGRACSTGCGQQARQGRTPFLHIPCGGDGEGGSGVLDVSSLGSALAFIVQGGRR